MPACTSTMSTISPVSLEDLCLSYICDNIDELCYEVQEPVGSFKKMAFKIPVFLHEQLAEIILRRLACSGKLTQKILSLFLDCGTCRLKRACIRESNIHEIGLRLLLMYHSITDLDIRDTGINFSELFVSSLDGYNCTSFLQRINISNVKGGLNPVALCSFKNLTCLDISRNEHFDDFELKLVCDSLTKLVELNISCTPITDADSFGSAKSRLRTLKAYNCPVAWKNPIDFAKFLALRHLDISRNPGTPQDYDWPEDAKKLEMLLQNRDALQDLEMLDISGTPRVMDTPLQVFLSTHPMLTFLGLCKTGLTSYAKFLPTDIEITGEATEQQILSSLHHYPERASYMTESLRRLFHVSKNWTKPRFEVLQLVLHPMEMHHNDLRVQMASTACAFNLTRIYLNEKDLHPSILGKIANLVLKAMAAFPSKHELLRNCLLILDSKSMLKRAKFHFYAACMSALDALCLFSNDLNVVRLATRICANLTAKISNYETIALGTDRHLKTLLHIVEEKVESKQGDDINVLSVTLSVLWNLTDEARCSCQMFIESKGLSLFMRVLKEFKMENKLILKKVLGTMNNIAEVDFLRHHFITDECMAVLSDLLVCDHIEVSYFAGGILSNVLLGWTQQHSTKHKKEAMLQLMEEAVLTWESPIEEMVAYRSFMPFLPLLNSGLPAIQLWAVWGILHVCTKNAVRYVPLLVSDGIRDVIVHLLIDTDCHEILKRFAEKLIEKADEFLNVQATSAS